MVRNPLCFLLLIVAGVAIGCSKNDPAPQDKKQTHAEGTKYLLATKPEGAKGVCDVRDRSQDGDEVTVVGRIGGRDNPWTDGLAAFTIVDPALKPCNEMGDDGCTKPWDYC